MSTVVKVIVFEMCLLGGMVVFLATDISPGWAAVYFLALGFASFLIRCPNCKKGVFVRDWHGYALFAVPWPNVICTRCGTTLVRSRKGVLAEHAASQPKQQSSGSTDHNRRSH